MAQKIGEFIIRQFEDNSAFVDLPEDQLLRTTMFAYYFDRIIHNLSSNTACELIDAMENTTNEFLEPIISKKEKNPQIGKLLENAYFGMHFEKESEKKAVFEAYGEYYKKNDTYFYLQTKFKPIFIRNDVLERNAKGSIVYFFDYILSYVSDKGAIFLMLVINNMSSKYKEKNNFPPIGEVPALSLAAISDTFF